MRAHMKEGDLSSYPIGPLPAPVLTAIETLVRLVDKLAGQQIAYDLSVGGQERRVDLRQSVSEGRLIEL